VTDTLAAAHRGMAALEPVLREDYVFASNPHANYDVMPDGSHFIFLQGDASGELMVVSNWDAVVRARMATGP
jgi:hypothetical protein